MVGGTKLRFLARSRKFRTSRFTPSPTTSTISEGLRRPALNGASSSHRLLPFGNVPAIRPTTVDRAGKASRASSGSPLRGQTKSRVTFTLVHDKCAKSTMPIYVSALYLLPCRWRYEQHECHRLDAIAILLCFSSRQQAEFQDAIAHWPEPIGGLLTAPSSPTGPLSYGTQ